MDARQPTCPECRESVIDTAPEHAINTDYLCPGCGWNQPDAGATPDLCEGCDDFRKPDAPDGLCERCAASCVRCGGHDARHEDDDEQRVCEACNDAGPEVCGEDGMCSRCWRVACWEAPIPRPTCREPGCRRTAAGPHEPCCEDHARRAA